MPHHVDIHVGKSVRTRRRQMDMTQKDLADLLGISFQQVQKYERGTNRIGASRLWQISKILDIHVRYFFEGLEAHTQETDDSSKSEADEIVRLINAIQNDDVKNQVLNLIKACQEI